MLKVHRGVIRSTMGHCDGLFVVPYLHEKVARSIPTGTIFLFHRAFIQDDSQVRAKRRNSAGLPQPMPRIVDGGLRCQQILVTIESELEHQRQDILSVAKTKHSALPSVL